MNDENAPLSVKSVTPDIEAACQEADKAIAMTDSERRELIVFMPSDGEDVKMEENDKSDDEDEVISNRVRMNFCLFIYF